MPSDELQHFGIKGMRWGHRRWQNNDGSFNSAGKQRYFGEGGNSQPAQKKSGILKTNFSKGQDYMTKKNGKNRSLVGGLVKKKIGHDLKSAGQNAAMAALVGAATIGVATLTGGNPIATKAALTGSVVAANMFAIKREMTYRSQQAGMVSAWADNRKKKKLAQG